MIIRVQEYEKALVPKDYDVSNNLGFFKEVGSDNILNNRPINQTILALGTDATSEHHTQFIFEEAKGLLTKMLEDVFKTPKADYIPNIQKFVFQGYPEPKSSGAYRQTIKELIKQVEEAEFKIR